MRELALHLLDLAENSVSAQARKICIRVEEDLQNDRLRMSIEDDGQGMDAEMLARICDPFVTSRTTRKVGLGIPLLKAAAEACDGSLTIRSQPGKGTLVSVDFKHSHIDRMPLGNLAATLLSLEVGHPDVRFVFTYKVDENEFTFDDAEIKAVLDGVSVTEAPVLRCIREMLEQGIAEVRQSSGVLSTKGTEHLNLERQT